MSSSKRTRRIQVYLFYPRILLVLTILTIELPESSIPPIEPTVESPLVYAYRTKITPHFERPPKYLKPQDEVPGVHPSWLKIGFNVANSNATMDIEVRYL